MTSSRCVVSPPSLCGFLWNLSIYHRAPRRHSKDHHRPGPFRFKKLKAQRGLTSEHGAEPPLVNAQSAIGRVCKRRVVAACRVCESEEEQPKKKIKKKSSKILNARCVEAQPGQPAKLTRPLKACAANLISIRPPLSATSSSTHRSLLIILTCIIINSQDHCKAVGCATRSYSSLPSSPFPPHALVKYLTT